MLVAESLGFYHNHDIFFAVFSWFWFGTFSGLGKSGVCSYGYFHMAILCVCVLYTGGRLNKKDGLTRYGNSHVKDKTS